MLFIIAGFIIGVWFIVGWEKDYTFTWFAWVGVGFKTLGAGLITALAGAIVWVLVGGLIGTVVIQEDDLTLVDSYPIYTLNDNFATNASFVLGSGRASGELEYYFFKEDDGARILKKAPAERVYIYYQKNGEQPRFEKYGYAGSAWFIYPSAIDPVYELHVPEGTIQTAYDYRIDLE